MWEELRWDRVQFVLSDESRKSWIQILRESLQFSLKHRELPAAYFGKLLYRKDSGNIFHFLSTRENSRIMRSEKLHRYEFSSLLRNKLAFALHLKNFDLPIPFLHGYNVKHTFHFDNHTVSLSSPDEMILFFREFFTRNELEKLFVKPAAEMGGEGCFILEKDLLDLQIPSYFSYLSNNLCLFQEILCQHAAINSIHSGSINTIRFDTYWDKNGNKHILSAAMRFGAGSSPVDNASSGGFFVLIDMEKAELYPYGRRLMRYGGAKVTHHPDSGVALGGTKIPWFDEARQLVLKAMDLIPDRLIGWDVAITPEGPVLVEGNDNNSMFASDIVTEGYKKHPLLAEIIKEA